MLSRCFLDFSVGVRASVIGLSQISSFSFSYQLLKVKGDRHTDVHVQRNMPSSFKRGHNKSIIDFAYENPTHNMILHTSNVLCNMVVAFVFSPFLFLYCKTVQEINK